MSAPTDLLIQTATVSATTGAMAETVGTMETGGMAEAAETGETVGMEETTVVGAAIAGKRHSLVRR